MNAFLGRRCLALHKLLSTTFSLLQISPTRVTYIEKKTIFFFFAIPLLLIRKKENKNLKKKGLSRCEKDDREGEKRESEAKTGKKRLGSRSSDTATAGLGR